MMLVSIVVWQYFHALQNCLRLQFIIIFFFRSNLLLCLLNTEFFKGRSTVTNLIEFTSYVLNCMENGAQVDAIYTDFSKAFYKVSHRLLLRKLAKLGFSRNFLAWIRSYLIGREQFVKASGSKSRKFSVRSGVPQGSHLRPLLFIYS
jgi:hypothetical protein